MKFTEVQLTFDASGHCINSTQCFSPDDQWIVYDARNEDSRIAGCGLIAMVNTGTGEMRTLYTTAGQTGSGPGVAAATFSPVQHRVLFLHGIRNASEGSPYGITRRTGVCVDVEHPGRAVFMDARDIKPPFTNGALRGGTHAHTWTGDGQWISFTYNDHIMEQASKTDAALADLRTIGVMVPGAKVVVQPNGEENNDGEMFTILAANVVPEPRPGSNETEKAFDETWIGTHGYRKPDGTWQKRAIAYQGVVRDEEGRPKTEIFIVDIPDNILEMASEISLTGGWNTRPPLPPGLRSRRISFTEKGVSAIPRHWLRSSGNGEKIGFLAEDGNGLIQLFSISPNEGAPVQITCLPFSIEGPLNFSPDGRYVSFVADASVFITEVENGICHRLTHKRSKAEQPVGAVVWSNAGDKLCYNRYVHTAEGRFLQIFLLKRTS